jgi:O-antigen ligase
MWLNALEQFKKNIFGLGAGQGGWISYIHDVNTNIVVTDGDYFRILLESGIFGIIVFCYLIGIVLLRFIRNGDSKVKYFYWFSVASGIQMVGSNITELYYANFAFWLALGLNHKFKHGKYLAASQKVVRYVA